MAQTKSGIALEDGESVVIEIEAELWASSSNPVARLFGDIGKFIAAVGGFKKKAFLIVTNKRVIEVATQIACYCITVGRQVKYVLPSSVKEIGFTKSATCGCFCPVYYLYYDSFTQRSSYQMKGADEAAAQKAASAFYSVIAQANV